MIKLAEILRDEVGPDFHLMHDAVQYYDLNEAIRVGRALEENGFTWFEEPVRDQDFRSLKKLREAVGVPVVAGESFPHHIHSYGQMLAMGAVDGIKPPVGSGGITETQKIGRSHQRVWSRYPRPIGRIDVGIRNDSCQWWYRELGDARGT